MILSNRMEAVVNMVSPQSFVIADIGCDHAYVSIALVERKLAQKVIAMDVRKGPLEIAKKNVTTYAMTDEIELRLSDGLDKILPGEAEVIIIAGMGGLLIRDILERGKKILNVDGKRPELILQPQSDLAEVRIFLQENAYDIQQEKMLIEEGKYYTIIKAVPKRDKVKYDEAELLYGRYNLQSQDAVLESYLLHEQSVLQEILEKLEQNMRNKTVEEIPEKTKIRIQQLKKQIEVNHLAQLAYAKAKGETNEV